MHAITACQARSMLRETPAKPPVLFYDQLSSQKSMT
jgi:hypothetical protein